ncbi:MAG: hypothetical protein WAN69_00435 [Candidatus Korobacteraceae bacterium]
MRNTEKAVAILILALWAWGLVTWAATSFQGHESNRILRVELGSDAASLNQAVAANDRNDKSGIAHNVQMVVRNTYMDFVFILLYWLTFLSLAFLAGRLGRRFLAACAALSISIAALSDLFENGAILTAMRVRPFTDPVAVDISEFSQWKWSFFFLASLFLGLAIAMNHRVSIMRRGSGGIFIASGAIGILGMSRYRVSLDFTMLLINIGLLLFGAALLLTLWKIYLSLKELNHLERVEPAHVHA